MKEAVSSALCLAMPDPTREFIMHTEFDAPGYSTGAVWMQQFESGLRSITFLSTKMTMSERNYPARAARDSQRHARVEPLPRRETVHDLHGLSIAAVRGGR